MSVRGVLRVYLGYAPGVGKTFSMLSEGLRRAERGTPTVIGVLTERRRVPLLALASRLDDRSVRGQLDVDGLLALAPSVVLIDDLAGDAGQVPSRWSEVDRLLEAGIDVVTTINVSDLESLRDVVARITGREPTSSVPDAFVRAGQVELVDMSPESLRRRLAHGNVFAPEAVDGELADYFRIGNLTALRELALTWLADRVEENLDEYRSAQQISNAWETRERIVVALTGAEGSDDVVRRAGRLAARTRAPLIGVHVVPENGLTSRAGPLLAAHRELLESLGGTYREVVGDDIAASLVEFANAERATQLVLGASPGRRRRRSGDVAGAVLQQATGLDVHVVGRESLTEPAPLARSLVVRRRRPIGVRRTRMAWAALVFGLPVLGVILLQFPNHVGVSAVLLLYLASVLAIAAIGGLVPGLLAALCAFLICNWFFVPPTHTFAISGAENLVALLVFFGVAATVSALVDRVSVRSAEALLARAEAETLARTSATIAGERDPLDHLMVQIRDTFGVRGVALLVREGDVWRAEATDGSIVPARPDDGDAFALDRSSTEFLVLVGATLTADDHRVLQTIAAQLRLALDARQHQESAARLDALAEANAVRTAMLQAVSHDLRTPLAGIKASATSLLSSEAVWTAEQRRKLLTTIDAEADRLNRIVGNLLDMSRLQAGAVQVQRRRCFVDELVENALASLSGVALDGNVDISVDADITADVDAALIERAVANVVANALVHSPDGKMVRIDAIAARDLVRLRIIDQGPGIHPHQRSVVFEPFQRLGDRGGAGVGLGLAVARGLVTASGGRIELDDTPGGGLTVTIELPGSVGESRSEPHGFGSGT